MSNPVGTPPKPSRGRRQIAATPMAAEDMAWKLAARLADLPNVTIATRFPKAG